MQATFIHLSGDKLGEREIFSEFPVRIGRSSVNNLILDSENTRASSRHAEVLAEGDRLIIKDLNSTNGTFINGIRISRAQLNPGDIIEFGVGGPKLSFEFDHIKTIMAGSHKPQQTFPPNSDPRFITPHTSALEHPDLKSGSSQHPELRGKEIGPNTMQIILDKAVTRSTLRWKVALALSFLAFGAITTLLVMQQLKPAPTPVEPARADRPKELSFSEIASRNQRAIVLIYNKFELYDKNGKLIQEQISNGSGFVANKNGDIITNRHVIEPWAFKSPQQGAASGTADARAVTGKIKQLGVFFADDPLDTEHMHTVKDYQLSKEADVAVLRISPPRDLQSVQSLNDDIKNLKQGDEIAVLAFPLGLELNELTQDKKAKSSLTRGIISKIPDNQRQIQLDVAAYEGSSGGPIFNREGEVIGLLTSGPNDTLNFATPIRYATKLLRSQ